MAQWMLNFIHLLSNQIFLTYARACMAISYYTTNLNSNKMFATSVQQTAKFNDHQLLLPATLLELLAVKQTYLNHNTVSVS